MQSITFKLAFGMLASLAATGMTGGPAFAASLSEAREEAVTAMRDRQWHAGELVKHPQSVTHRFTGWASHARAAAGNVGREAQQ